MDLDSERGDFVKRKNMVIRFVTVFLFLLLAWLWFEKSHTHYLSDVRDAWIKSEQIQPITGSVTVSGTVDTDVVFTEVVSGERYKIDYITPGMSEKIRLERGKWYQVAGGGTLTVGPGEPSG